MVYEFCADADAERAVGRRLLLGNYAIVLAGERWTGGEWRLDNAVMAWPAISRERAAKLIGDAALDEPGVERASGSPEVAAIDAEIRRILDELPWARPGTWDYDHEMDKIAAVRAAYARLAAN